MSTENAAKGPMPANIVWFEIPAENVEGTRKFYGDLFGWKSDRMPGPMEYWHFDTGGPDASPDGGLVKRQNPGHKGIINYISVPSVSEWSAKVEKLGGKICMPKMAVTGMGWFAICQDPDENTFGLWESDSNAK